MRILRLYIQGCGVFKSNLIDFIRNKVKKSQPHSISEAEYFALMEKLSYAQPERKYSREELNER